MATVTNSYRTVSPLGTANRVSSQTQERRNSYKSSRTTNPAAGSRETLHVTSRVTAKATERSPTINEAGTSYRFSQYNTSQATVNWTGYEPTRTDAPYAYENKTTETVRDADFSVFAAQATGYSYTAGRSTFQYRSSITSTTTTSNSGGSGSSSQSVTRSMRGYAKASYNSGPGAVNTTTNSTTTTTLTRYPTSYNGTKLMTVEQTYTDRTSTQATMTVAGTTQAFANWYADTGASPDNTVFLQATVVAATDFFFTRNYNGDPSLPWGRLPAGTYPQSMAPRLGIDYSEAYIQTDDGGNVSRSYQTGAKAWGYGSVSRTCVVTETASRAALGTSTNGLPLTGTETFTVTKTKESFYEDYGEPVEYSETYSYNSYVDIRSNYPGYFEKAYNIPTPTLFFPGNFGVRTHTVCAMESPYQVVVTASITQSNEAITTNSTIGLYETQVTADSRSSLTLGEQHNTFVGVIPLYASRVFTEVSQATLWGDGVTEYDDTLEFRGLVYTYKSTDGFGAFPGASVGSNLDGGLFSPTVKVFGSTVHLGPRVPVLFGTGTAEAAGIKYSTTYLGDGSFSYQWSGGSGVSDISAVGGEQTYAAALPLTPAWSAPQRSTVGPYGHDITLSFVPPRYSYSHFAEFRYTSLSPDDPAIFRTHGSWRIMPWEPANTRSTLALNAGHCLLIAAAQTPVVTNFIYTTRAAFGGTYDDWNQTFNFDPWAGL